MTLSLEFLSRPQSFSVKKGDIMVFSSITYYIHSIIVTARSSLFKARKYLRQDKINLSFTNLIFVPSAYQANVILTIEFVSLKFHTKL